MPHDLSKISTSAPKDTDKNETKQQLASICCLLSPRHSLLAVIRRMDAGGKDGAIKNVFGPL